MRGSVFQRFGSPTLFGVVCALALLAFAGTASAVVGDSAADSFTIDFGGNIDRVDVTGPAAQAVLEVESISGNTLVLNVTLTNTSSVLFETARVSAFGFDTNPDVVSASLESSVFGNVNMSGSSPNGFGSIDLCVINNRSGCSGGRGGGLAVGESTLLPLALNFHDPVSAVDLENFSLRYQSRSSSTLGLSGDAGTGRPTSAIPEPRSSALFVLGALFVVGLARKQVLTARC